MKNILAGTTLSKGVVLTIGADGYAYPAGINSGFPVGVAARSAVAGEPIKWTPRGKGNICEFQAGGAVSAGDMCYVTAANNGLLVSYPFTGTDLYNIGTGFAEDSSSVGYQLQRLPYACVVALASATSGNTFDGVWI